MPSPALLAARSAGVHVAAGFDPSVVAGLKLDYDPQSESLSDGDGVGTAHDRTPSGGLGNGTQGTANNKPTFKTGILNSKAVFRFAEAGANSDWLGLPNLSALTAGTVFIVVKINNDPPLADAQTGLWTLSSALSTHFPYTDGTIYDAFGTDTRKTTVNPTLSLASWRIYEVVSKSGEWSSYLDGTQLFTTATNTVQFPDTAKLGASRDSPYYLDGDVARFLLYNSGLNSTDRGTIRTGLQGVYGL